MSVSATNLNPFPGSMEPSGEVITPNEMQYEQPMDDVNKAHQGWYLWDLAKQESPDRDVMWLFFGTLIMFAYFCTWHIVQHEIYLRFNQKYKEMKPETQALYRAYVVSIVHCIGCVIMSYLAMWHVCPGEETVFNSEHCMNTVRHIHIWALLHTCGYFINDFFVLKYLIKGDSPLDRQTLWHHLLGAIVYYETLMYMDFCTVFGTMLLFTEISTIFLSIRYLLYTHDMSQSMWYYANVSITFILFLTARLYFQCYISFVIGLPYAIDQAEKDHVSYTKGLMIIQMSMIVLASIILNFYWFYLMCKMIYRVLSRMG
jgi:hypothetical protein